MIWLAKSFSSETNPTSRASRGSLLTQPQPPANHAYRESAVGENRVVERAQRESRALGHAEVVPQSQQLAPAHRVTQRVGRRAAVAAHLRLGVAAVHVQRVDHLVHGLRERDAAGVQAHVEQDAQRAPQQEDAMGVVGRMNAGVGTTWSGASGIGARALSTTKSRARVIARAYEATSALAAG